MKQVIVRSVEDYWNDFILDGLKNHISPDIIRGTAVSAAQSEMEDLMKFRMNVEDLREAPYTEQNKRKVENVAKQMFKKWNRLCTICRRYKETRDILRPEDLKWEEKDRDASEEADYNEDDMGDDGYPLPEEDE